MMAVGIIIRVARIGQATLAIANTTVKIQAVAKTAILISAGLLSGALRLVSDTVVTIQPFPA